jgi:hypothetical protein
VDSLVKKRLKLNVIQTHLAKAIPIPKSMIHGGVSRVQAVKEILPILEIDGLRSLIGQKPSLSISKVTPETILCAFLRAITRQSQHLLSLLSMVTTIPLTLCLLLEGGLLWLMMKTLLSLHLMEPTMMEEIATNLGTLEGVLHPLCPKVLFAPRKPSGMRAICSQVAKPLYRDVIGALVWTAQNLFSQFSMRWLVSCALPKTKCLPQVSAMEP